MASTLHEQIEAAKAQVRKMKKVAPYLYHEYSEYREAKANLEAAQVRFRRAKAAWDAFPDNSRLP